MTTPAQSANRARVLVAGIGNVFLGDDAFGVEVAQRLRRRSLPAGARVVDFGIRGIDLSFALLEGYETVILVDATSRGQEPGTVYVIDPAVQADEQAPATEALLSAHHLDPANVLQWTTAMDANIPRIILVGCEPHPIDEEADLPMRVSPLVEVAVSEAVELVSSLVTLLLKDNAALIPPMASGHQPSAASSTWR